MACNLSATVTSRDCQNTVSHSGWLTKKYLFLLVKHVDGRCGGGFKSCWFFISGAAALNPKF